jgi:peptide/nickel transport system substrate-binding protein
MYTQYDPSAANKLLDELGLKDTNGDGFRELNGKPLSINYRYG